MPAMKRSPFKGRQLRYPRGNGKETSKDRNHWDCAHWTSKTTVSRRDSCSFKHRTVATQWDKTISVSGTLDPDGEKKMPTTNKLQESGISLPCRRRPATLTTSFSRIASTWPITKVVQFSSTRTPSTPTSMSSPSTFMTQDESYPIKSWKENREGSCKVFFHVPHFVDHQWAGRSTLQRSLFISATFTPKRKVSPRSSSLLFVPLWFLKKLTWFQVSSLVLHGSTAAKTTSVLLTKHLRTVPCLRHRPPHHCGDLDPFLTCGQTSTDFSNRRVLNFFFGKWISMVHSPSHGKH